MAKKGLAKKGNNRKSGSLTRHGTSGKSKSKDASVDDDLKIGALKDEVMRKAAGARSKEEKSVEKKSSKSKVAVDDDLKIAVLKYERKAAGNKSKGEISVTKKSRKSNDVVDDDLKVGALKDKIKSKVAGDKSKGEKFVPKQSRKSEDADVDDHQKIGVLKDEVTTKVSDGKSKGEKSAAKKSEFGDGAKLFKEEEGSETNMLKESFVNTNTPMKRKRGADGEIVHAFLSSPESSSSRLRPRNAVPTFRLVDLDDDDNDRVIGKRVKVYWSGSRKWFTGRIKAFDCEKRLHNILYEDGDIENLDLRKERFELEIMPTEDFKLRTKPSSEKKVKGLDGDKVSAEMLNEEIEVDDAERVLKLSEPKKKNPSERYARRGSSKSLRKDPKVKNAEELVAEMDVDVLTDKADEVIINEAHDVEERLDSSYGKEQDGSKYVRRGSSKSQRKDPKVKNAEELVAAMDVDVLPEKADEVIINEAHDVEEHLDSSYGKEQDGSKYARRGSSKSQRKDPKVKNAEELVAEMDVDVLPEKADEVIINEAHDVEDHLDSSYRKEQDGSKMDEEATKVIGLQSKSEVKELGSDNVEMSRKSVKDDSIKVHGAESEKKHVSSKKRATSGAAKVIGSKSPQHMKVSKEEEDLHAIMEVDPHPNEIKNNTMEVDPHHNEIKNSTVHGDITFEKSVEVSYQEDEKIGSLAPEISKEEDLHAIMEVGLHHNEIKNNTMHGGITIEKSVEVSYQEDEKIGSLAPEISERKGGMSSEAQPNTSNFNVKKKEDDQAEKQTETEDAMASKDAINTLCLISNPHGAQDYMEVAANAEVSVHPNKVEETPRSRQTNVEGSGYLDTIKSCDEDESLPKAASERACAVSVDVLPTLPKDPEILQGKVQVENSKSEEDICKDEGDLTSQKTVKTMKAKDNESAESLNNPITREDKTYGV